MIKALLSFDVILAFKYNPLMFILLIVGIIYIIIITKNYILLNKKPEIDIEYLDYKVYYTDDEDEEDEGAEYYVE